MSNVALNLKLRSIQGKGASRRLRKTGMVPGVLYGGDGPATVIELDHKTLLLQLNTRDFQSSIITIDIDGDKQDVLLRDYQMHPWKKQILHVARAEKHTKNVMAQLEIFVRAAHAETTSKNVLRTVHTEKPKQFFSSACAGPGRDLDDESDYEVGRVAYPWER